MAVAENALIRIREKRIYLIAAILFSLIVLLGFGRTYYVSGFFSSPPLSSYLVQIHGALMTAWVTLFVAQVFLIRTKNIKVHQKIGLMSIALAVLIVISGFFTAIAAAKNGSASSPPDIPRLAFLAVPLFDLLVFAVLFAAAVYYRKKAANHKRLMLLIAISLLPPAIARVPGMMALGPMVFFGVPTLLTLVALGYDRWLTGKFNRVFVYGALFLIASYPLRLALSGTEAWMSFAAWLTTFSPV
jgi:hypothetical protein